MTRLVFAFILALLLPWSAHADERILHYDVDIQMAQNGSFTVTERIKARAEGKQIKRGIFREIPTRYKGAGGLSYDVQFKLLEVLRDGDPTPHDTEARSNGVRINMAGSKRLKVPSVHTWTIRYQVSREARFFDDHDELYWNATGTDWAFPIDQVSVTARLPEPVPVADLSAEGYTGAKGAKGSAYVAELTGPGEARWQTTRPLGRQQGLTVVLSFPKGVIAQPSAWTRLWWSIGSWSGALVAVLGLLAMLLYCAIRWWQVGRDPRAGTIIARYEPPQGHSPGGARYLWKQRFDGRCFTSSLVAEGVAGKLQIQRKEKTGSKSDAWSLQRTGPASTADDAGAGSDWLQTLFKGAGDAPIKLSRKNRSSFQTARSALEKHFKKTYVPRYLKTNGGSLGIALLIGAIGVALGFLLAGAGTEKLVVVICAFLVIVVMIPFAWLIPSATLEGRQLLDHVEGLKLYLSVAERDQIESLRGPDAEPRLDARRYEAMLPWAVALDVEEAWTGKFTAAVGAAAAAAATASYAWYQGGSGSGINEITDLVGSGLDSQIAAASSTSSSGVGGGGSSGGGGGGGGGGGI